MGGGRGDVPKAPSGVGRGPLGKGLGVVWEGRRLCPLLRKFFVFFLLKIPYFDAFWHVYFLNHTPMGGVQTPLTPSSVRH